MQVILPSLHRLFPLSVYYDHLYTLRPGHSITSSIVEHCCILMQASQGLPGVLAVLVALEPSAWHPGLPVGLYHGQGARASLTHARLRPVSHASLPLPPQIHDNRVRATDKVPPRVRCHFFLPGCDAVSSTAAQIQERIDALAGDLATSKHGIWQASGGQGRRGRVARVAPCCSMVVQGV